MELTALQRFVQTFAPAVFSRAELLSAGTTGRDITRAVEQGRLLRLRRDHYTAPDVDARVAEAVRIGGRVTCLTLLQMLGVFVRVSHGLHVHLPPHASRRRPARSASTRLHWSGWRDGNVARHVVPLRVALCQAVRCQDPRAAVATLDSVLHHRLMTREEMREMFAELPQRFAALLRLVDGSAESGPETYMRLILRALGVQFETQVMIRGVGRVDFVVEGWLIIECDSKEFHEGWDKQVEDRARDIAAARLGYVTIRPIAADILTRGSTVRTAIADVIDMLGPRFTGARGSQLRRNHP